ncbi:MAG: CRISPR system precrRNA processing endoribonuclease RAMP protein Cas6, partial [Proteobacteria bacterium]|nr:CRISPR system precrRNA processing endoribonuclease RAMP protein Cas6 [Pseudomonadota bacterium]
RWTALEAGVAQSIVGDVMPAIGDTFDLSGQSWRVTAKGVPPSADEPGSRPESDGSVAGGTSATGVHGNGEPGVASSPRPLAPTVLAGTPRSPWAGTGTCEALARLHLIGGRRPAPRVELQFTTPTTFHSQGRSMPLPLPRLVFGSLLDRWNAFAPLRIDPEILVVVEQACTIARYDLRTEAVPLGGGLQIGFVGRCTYGLPPGRGIRPADEYAWRVLHLLASFAFFAGVGAKTTMGMGTVRMLPGR